MPLTGCRYLVLYSLSYGIREPPRWECMISFLSRPKRRPHLLTCMGTDWDVNLPEHFIRHYLGLGIRPQDFVVALHSDKRDFLEPTQKILRQYGIEPRRIWRGDFDSKLAGKLKFELQKEFIPQRDWIVHADLDEFHEYPAPLMEYLEERERRRENIVAGCFVDRVTADGSLPCIQHVSQGSLFEQFPRCADIVGGVKKATTLKYMAFRAYFEATGGNHRVGVSPRTFLRPFRRGRRPRKLTKLKTLSFEERLQRDVRVHHFGWSLDTVEKCKERREHYRALGFSWFEQSQLFLDALDDEGRLHVPTYDP